MAEHAAAQKKPVNPSLLKPTAVYLFLAYFLWPFSLIGLAVEREDELIRFHCAQAFAFCVLQVILGILLYFFTMLAMFLIGIPFMIVAGLIMLAYYVLLIITLIKAAGGEKYKMFLIGDMAEKAAQKWFL